MGPAPPALTRAPTSKGRAARGQGHSGHLTREADHMMSLGSEAKGQKVRCVTNKPNPHISARPAPHTRMALFPSDHRPPLSSHLLLSEKPGWMEQHPLVISSLKHGHLNPCWSIKTSMSSHCGTVGKGPGIAIAVAQIPFPGTSKKKEEDHHKTALYFTVSVLFTFSIPSAPIKS